MVGSHSIRKLNPTIDQPEGMSRIHTVNVNSSQGLVFIVAGSILHVGIDGGCAFTGLLNPKIMTVIRMDESTSLKNFFRFVYYNKSKDMS